MSADINRAKHVHFIGIGGIGISGIARMLKLQGKTVTGSDRAASEVTEGLEKAGIPVVISHEAKNIPEACDLVIYTVAIPEDNPEMAEAQRRGIPMLSYPQTLNFISKEKYTIAVSGTHGKTTTTAMIAAILIEAGLDPTVLVGSLIADQKTGESTNFVLGKGTYFVVEADEYKKSFHNLEPSILIINNIDADHLDFYRDLADIQNSFRELALKIPKDGFVICDPSDPHVAPAIQGLQCTIIDATGYLPDFNLSIAGEHNRQNASRAIALATVLKIDDYVVETALEKFKGPWRRFEYKGVTKNGVAVYDDYAHNPQKVRAAILGAREAFPGKKIVVAFQPHLFSRTKVFLNEFADSLSLADLVLLVPIYPAREAYDPSINSAMLAEKIADKHKSPVIFEDFAGLERYIDEHLSDSSSVLITMGAGDIYTVSEAVISKNILDK